MKKTKLLTTLGAVALIGAIGVGSTFAYLSDKTGTVTNTFTVGNVQFDEDLNGGLSESAVKKDTNGNYVRDTGKNKWTEDHAEYKDIVAGSTLYKDPTVHIAEGSEECWVFAKIENNNANLKIEYSPDWTDVTDAYCNAKGIDSKTANYVVYAKTSTIPGNPTEEQRHSTIFTEVKVDSNITGETEFTPINVSACAVQAAGFANYDAENLLKEVAFN